MSSKIIDFQEWIIFHKFFFFPKFYFPVTFPLQIIEKGLMTRADYEEASEKALKLFEYGQVISLFD
jgi:hypothetical protein